MRLSKLFTSTSKNVPADETAKNAQLLIRAGFIHKEMAGVYSFLPLGLRVLNKIADVVREEMNAIGAQEILMPALQIKERYELTNRWDDKEVDNWFKTKLANGTELGLGFSHEENLSPIVKNFVNSYKDLPIAIYQIQTKFRNELRSKSGLMREREFLMKDMYSYALDQKQHDKFYEKASKSYEKIFDRLGIGDKTFLTFASGSIFSKFSHEFQTISEAGEDTIYLDKKSGQAINKEVLSDENIKHLGVQRSDLEELKGIEVGNIFSLGTKFSAPFEVVVADETGKLHTLIMGCYGIGVSRLMGTIAEVLSDEKGLVWPENVAPARAIIVSLGNNPKITQTANKLYETLQKKGIEVLYDDRELSAGEKFADADLIGVPFRVVVSAKTFEQDKFELKQRTDEKIQLLDEQGIIETLC